MMLARSNMDPNRNEEEGAQGRALAQWAYHEFHGKIAQVLYSLIRNTWDVQKNVCTKCTNKMAQWAYHEF